MERDVQYEEDSENRRKARFRPLPIPASPCPKNRKDEATQLPEHAIMDGCFSEFSIRRDCGRDQSVDRTGNSALFRDGQIINKELKVSLTDYSYLLRGEASYGDPCRGNYGVLRTP
jgi:hypothetical protein